MINIHMIYLIYRENIYPKRIINELWAKTEIVTTDVII